VSPVVARLLAGPSATGGAESYRDHVARLGRRPLVREPESVLGELDAAGLTGRGGAGFPVGRKWRTVAERGARGTGGSRLIVNGAEGEPLSAKDRVLMASRPHLVLDGARLAAEVVGASEIVLYVGMAHVAARAALVAAIREREPLGVPVRLAEAPDRYVAGEESAAVHFVNEGDARPVTVPPRPFERGVAGRPTLVQNVESLAHAALITRFGADWYREAGRSETRGTALVTLTGGPRAGVWEIELGATLAEVADLAGTSIADVEAVLIGGYFGGWVAGDEARNLVLDPGRLRAEDRAFGCGVVSFVDHDCGVRATARIVDYMAGESAGQCGPCVFGLRSIADAVGRIAAVQPRSDDLPRIERWTAQLVGRGACRHPDGAAGLLTSAMRVFSEEFTLHVRSRRCSRPAAARRVA
jgi:NADH:ubiquinone oxidoreductase subunit F (NADH-binding)